MIDLKKLQQAAKTAATPKASIKTVSAEMSPDGVLIITAQLIGAEPNSSGRSIPVASFSGTKVEGAVSFRTPDGTLVSVPGLVAHIHGGISVYHRDEAVRLALGLSTKGGDQ